VSRLSPASPPRDIHAVSLHDALPIFARLAGGNQAQVERPDDGITPAGHKSAHVEGRAHRGAPAPDDSPAPEVAAVPGQGSHPHEDRKSTRLNSSHVKISYAVFCLKKK